MPAESKAQQRAAGVVLSAKRRETRKAQLKGASTKHKGKPERKTR